MDMQRGPGEHEPGQQAPGDQGPGQEWPPQQSSAQQVPGQQAPGQQWPAQPGFGQQAPGQHVPPQQWPPQQWPPQQWPGQPGWRLAGPASGANWLWVLLGALGGIIGFFKVKDRNRGMAWGILGVGVGLSVIAVIVSVVISMQAVSVASQLGDVTAGSYNDSTGPVPSEDPVPTETTGPAPSRTPIDGMRGSYLFTKKALYTFDYATEEGYTSTATFAVGPVGHYSDTAIDPSADPQQSCDMDPNTDALVPFALEVQNSTAGFDQVVHSALYNGGSSGDVMVMRAYTDGPKCDEWGSTATAGSSDFASLNVRSTDPIAQDHYISLDGYFVLKGYFTPAAPNGDPAKLADLTAHVQAAPTDDGATPLSTCTGPGVVVNGAPGQAQCQVPFGSQL